MLDLTPRGLRDVAGISLKGLRGKGCFSDISVLVVIQGCSIDVELSYCALIGRKAYISMVANSTYKGCRSLPVHMLKYSLIGPRVILLTSPYTYISAMQPCSTIVLITFSDPIFLSSSIIKHQSFTSQFFPYPP